ncbi:DUF6687 family protein [Ilumatobacter sp.]|uniref:DUF6687 family protein n=1 Tax=Ilumatobacter sp. TaxID=1967498 RepID=UPI003AF5F9DA
MRYDEYEASRTTPNIVVDGSPNEATVLTLSHWPGIPAPTGLARDLSAEMAFAYLDAPPDHPAADIVTNNHFDQDGLISIFALTEPDAALPHRELLVDVAAAGDFATYRDRRAARAAMAMARRGAAETTCSYSEFTHELYTALLPEVLPMTLDDDRYRDLWGDEDAELTASEQAIAAGRVTFDERPDLDLAIVTIDDGEPSRSGHRFGHDRFDGLHPMALHNATDRFRLLLIHGRTYRYVDRYETWVQYRSRPTLPRIDMRPLADELTALESGRTRWTAGAPAALTPELAPGDESTIDRAVVTDAVVRHLRRGTDAGPIAVSR